MSDTVKIVLVVVVIIVILAGTNGAQYYFNSKAVQEIVEEYESEKQEMQEYLASLGDLITVYKVRPQDGVKAGAYIQETDLVEQLVPESLVSEDAIRSLSSISRKKWRIAQPHGTLVGRSMVRSDEYDNTSRPWVISLDAYPVSMQIGDLIDIYLVMPRGEMLLAYSQVEVRDILDGKLVVWFNLTEQLLFQGLSEDVELYRQYGGYLMAAKYVDQGVQSKPATFYVPPYNIALLMDANPNMIDHPQTTALNDARAIQDKLFDSEAIDPEMLRVYQQSGTKRQADLQAAYQAWLKRYEEAVAAGEIAPAPIRPDTGGLVDMTNPPRPEEDYSEPGVNEDGGPPLNDSSPVGNGEEPEPEEEIVE